MKITIAVATSSHAVSPLFALGAGAAGAACAAGAAVAASVVAAAVSAAGAASCAGARDINPNIVTPHAIVSMTASTRSFQVLTVFFMSGSSVRSQGVGVDLAGADPHHLIDRAHEDLSVAGLAGDRGLADRLDDRVDAVVGDRGLELDLGQEVDDVFGAAVELGVAFLAAEALDLGDRDARDAHLRERLADVVELEGSNDGGDEFHVRWTSRLEALRE